MGIHIRVGDIVEQKADAVVNPANKTLLGGGGVDGAIHRAAGEELYEACLALGGCETGEAKITKGYNLPTQYIIHTVGPIYGEEQGREDDLLKNCYRNSLTLAKEHNIECIVFPAISTGAFRFPKEEAAKIAVETVKEFLKDNNTMEVIFIFRTPWDAEVYCDLLGVDKLPFFELYKK